MEERNQKYHRGFTNKGNGRKGGRGADEIVETQGISIFTEVYSGIEI